MKKVLFILVIIIPIALKSRAQVIEGINTPDQEQIFTTNLDTEPEFKGGMEKFYSRLQHIPYTWWDRASNHQGSVIVMMIIEKDGSVSNLKVIHGFSDKQDAEILSVIRSSNKWKPGTRNGKPVRVMCAIPISFRLKPFSDNG